jgi:succinate dehydrogenase/fumarate reductase flavoprotein subunit
LREHRTDVLVVGSGGAGLRAAIAAADRAPVTLVSKGPLGRSGATILAGADIMADGGSLARFGYPDLPGDTPDAWARDIVIEGFHLNDENLVAAYVQNAGARVEELLSWGMTVHGTEERAVLTTGMSICAALRRGIAERASAITQVENVTVVDLLMGSGRVVGALAVDFESGELVLFRAKTVVLATGGWHRAYRFNAGADELTGDGQAMAYRAGAELVDMEMVTFAPNILLAPPRYRGSLWFYILPGTLLNARGDAFMAWEAPEVAKLAATTEWNKLLYSKASMREMKEGRGGPLGGVYYSLRHMPTNVFDALEEAYPGWRFQGDDFSELMGRMRAGEAVEVAPAAEYFEGGIRINERCETSIPGLYAAGECSGGLFGANRVVAATTEMVVEGEIAGREAAARAAEIELFLVDKAWLDAVTQEQETLLRRAEGASVLELRRRLQDVAYDQVGVLRSGAALRGATADLQEIEAQSRQIGLKTRRRGHNREWVDAIELRNMVQCVHASALAAQAREESRGVHVREDRPFVDNRAWRRHVLIRQSEGHPDLDSAPVVSDDALPKERVAYEDAILRAAKARVGRESEGE